MKLILKELKLSLISILSLFVFYGTFALLYHNPLLWFVFILAIVVFMINRIIEYVIIPSLKGKDSTKFNKIDQSRSYNHENTSIDSSSERPRFWKDVNKNDKDFRTSFSHENFNKPTGGPPLKYKRSDELNK